MYVAERYFTPILSAKVAGDLDVIVRQKVYKRTQIDTRIIKARCKWFRGVKETGSMNNNGDILDGYKTYSVTLLDPIPARDFWSFIAYDNHTRAILDTDQKTGGIDSKLEGMQKTEYGCTTLFFRPKARAGQENNWVKAMPNTVYNVLLRLYDLE